MKLEALHWGGELIEKQLDTGKTDEPTAKAMRRTVAVIRFDAEGII